MYFKTGLSFSRASAFCINMNAALILIPVCRNFISYTRYFLVIILIILKLG